MRRHGAHDAKVAAVHQGKQQWQAAQARLEETAAPDGDRGFGPDNPDYTQEHEQVFAGLADAQEANGGEAVYLDEVARRCGLPRDRVRELLHDLAVTHRLITEVEGTDDPDLGPRFEEKPRLLACRLTSAAFWDR